MLFSKFLKIGLYVVAGLFILAGGALTWAYQYRDDVFQYLLKEANAHIRGTVTARKLDFTPFAGGFGLSFTLFDIHLRDSAYVGHHKELLTLERLTVQIDLRQLLRKKLQINSVTIEEGKLSIFVDKNGYSNLQAVAPKDSSSTQDTTTNEDGSLGKKLLKSLRLVKVKEMEVNLQDSLKGKNIHFCLEKVAHDLGKTDTCLWVHLRGKTYFNQLTFNVDRGAFLENKETELDLHLSYDLRRHIVISPSEVQVADDKFRLRGSFDFEHQGRVQLYVETDTIAAPRALSILPRRLAKRIAKHRVLPVVKAEVSIDGPLKGGKTPHIEVEVQTKTFVYKSAIGPLTQTLGRAHFTNRADTSLPASDKNSRLVAPQVSGLLYGVIPMNLSFTISDFDEPFLHMEGNAKANFARCKVLFDPNQVQPKGGNMLVNFCYKGKIDPIFDAKNNRLNGTLDGNAKLERVAFIYTPQRIGIHRVDGFVRFAGDNANLTYLHIYHQKNQVRVSGNVSGLTPYAFGTTASVKGNVAIFAPDLGLDWIRNYRSIPQKTTKKQLSDITAMFIQNLDLKVQLAARRIHYRKFVAQQVSGKVRLTPQSIRCEDVKMQAFGGDFQVTGGIEQFDLPTHRMYAKGNVRNADVQKVFYAFENFGQQTVSDQNLSGNLSTAFTYSSKLNKNFGLIPQSMSGLLNFELLNGQLNRFGPLLRIQKLLFKRRNFQQIRFDTLKNQFTLQGQEISMGQMKVASTVLTFYVGGTYSFRDKTDLLVQIPLTNLKRNRTEAEVESLDGNNLLIRAVDEQGSIRLKYDMDWNRKSQK